MHYEKAMKEAVDSIVGNPEAHARLNRASQALFAVASIEDPHPAKAIGHMLGTAIEYAKHYGMTREMVLKVAADIFDVLDTADGEKLRQAAKKQQG